MPDVITPSSTPATTPVVAAPATAGGKKPVKKPNMVKFTDKNGKTFMLPENAFQVRVQRDAEQRVKARLGVSLEEAEAIVKRGGVQATATSTVDEALRKENEKLRRESETRKRELELATRKHKKDITRLKDRQVDAELRLEAQRAGIVDPGYAVHLFSEAVRASQTNDPVAFFAGMKKSHPHFFVAPVVAAPVEIPATTAPPESTQPGGVTPTPANAGTPTAPTNAEDMSTQDFNNYTRRQYGFSPGS